MKDLTYKCHTLAINELPNFDSKDRLYRGMSIIDGKDWKLDANTIDRIVEVFKSRIDCLEMDKAYKQVCDSWGSNWKKVTYKNWNIGITVRRRYKDHQLVYLGEFIDINYKLSSIESISYDKVISKFEKFVDEYCTEWNFYRVVNYRGYALTIQKEWQKDLDHKVNYFGLCEIHKNSKFKYITNDINKIEEKFKARIDQVIQYRTEATTRNSKEERIKQLQSEIAKLQQQIEEIKNEKETLTYKEIILEYGTDKAIREGWLVGRIKDAPLEAEVFYASSVSDMRDYFEAYIDKLEKSYNLYSKLMGY